MLSGVRGQNGSPGRCWGRIFAVSVEGDVLSFFVYTRGPRNRQLNMYYFYNISEFYLNVISKVCL